MAIQRKLSCAAHFYGARHMGGWATVVGEWRPHWLQASGAHEPLDAPTLANLVQAAIAQLAARRSHNPKVVSSILTRRILEHIPLNALASTGARAWGPQMWCQHWAIGSQLIGRFSQTQYLRR